MDEKPRKNDGNASSQSEKASKTVSLHDLTYFSEGGDKATEGLEKVFDGEPPIGAIAAAKAMADINPSLKDYASALPGMKDILDSHERASSVIADLDKLRHKEGKQNIFQDDILTSPLLTDQKSFRDHNTEEFRDKLVNALELQNEEFSKMLTVQREMLNSSKKSGKWTIASTIFAAIAAVVAVFSLIPSLDLATFSELVAAEEGSDLSSSHDEVATSEEASEAKVQPEPSPTAARAPADNAESSSDQHAP